MGNKTFDFSSKKKDFLPKNDQIWPKIGIFGQFGPGHAGFFGALLVGRLVVVARGLYLARHLFTLSSPRAKRAGPKGPRAESARAVTGRRNSYRWEGGRLFEPSAGFFYGNSCNFGTKSRKIISKVGN